MADNDEKSERPRVGAASKAADAIRNQIVAGDILPGQRLPEEKIRNELGVSRSSLREGFRLLIQDRLLVHKLSRGFFVRELTRGDIADLYQVRRVVECGAVQQVDALTTHGLKQLSQALSAGQQAVIGQNWSAVAAASIAFHQTLVDLAESARLSWLARQVLTEFRLSYAYMVDPLAFHEPFSKRNQEIADLVRSGSIQESVQALDTYLRDSEEALLHHHFKVQNGSQLLSKNSSDVSRG